MLGISKNLSIYLKTYNLRVQKKKKQKNKNDKKNKKRNNKKKKMT